MSKNGWLIWRERFIEWTHHGFASKTDLTYKPRFELTVMDGKRDRSRAIKYDNIQINDGELRSVEDFTKLPGEVQEIMLNNAVEAWEQEYARR